MKKFFLLLTFIGSASGFHSCDHKETKLVKKEVEIQQTTASKVERSRSKW